MTMHLDRELLPYSSDIWSRLSDDWAEIQTGTRCTSWFLSPPWMELWLTHYGPALRPLGVRWRDGSQTVAVGLLSRRTERRSVLRFRRLYLNATGEHELASEHNSILCHQGFEREVFASLWQLASALGADELILAGFDPGAAAAIAEAADSSSTEGLTSPDCYIDLSKAREHPEGTLGHLSGGLRSQLRRCRRLYEDMHGPLALDTCRSADDARAMLDELRELHAARWTARGITSGFLKPTARVFHNEMVRRHAAREVHLLRVRAGERTIGMLYNYVFAGRVNFYQSGFAYESDNRLKPGLLSHVMAADYYARLGLLEYDFLAGEADAARYKASLSTGRRSLEWRTVSRRTATVLVYRFLVAARQRWRSLKSASTAPGQPAAAVRGEE